MVEYLLPISTTPAVLATTTITAAALAAAALAANLAAAAVAAPRSPSAAALAANLAAANLGGDLDRLQCPGMHRQLGLGQHLFTRQHCRHFQPMDWRWHVQALLQRL